MQRPTTTLALDARLQRLLESFAVEPTDLPAFRTLEEGLFLAGAWSELAGVYECRLAALEKNDPEQTVLRLRLGRLLDERLGDARAARQRFEELLRIQPGNREALAALRELHTRAGEFAASLQIAEMEAKRRLPPSEAASIRAEMGELWLRMGDSAEARRHFDQALDLDPGCDAALAGRARLAEEEGRRSEAIRLLERRLDGLRGAARADTMEQLAALLPEQQKDRKRALLREVIREGLDRKNALEQLIHLEKERGSWGRVDELQRKLWRLIDPAARSPLALSAARSQLDEAGDVEAALYWAARADEVGNGEVRVQELRAEVFRRAGQTAALTDALERLIALSGPTPERSLELAHLYERDGQPECAAGLLRVHLTQNPDDLEALQLLARCLGRLGHHAERAAVLERLIPLVEDAPAAAELELERAALLAEKLDDRAGAERALRAALEKAPESEAAAQRLSELLHASGRLEELAGLLEELAGRNAPGPARAHILRQLGTLRLELLDDADGARKAFLEALDADARCLDAIQGLRLVATASGDESARLEACERELQLDPERARAAELLREILDLCRAAQDLPRARSAAERWAELEPELPAWRALADLGHKLGDPVSERRGLEALESLLIDDATERARVRAQLGDLALAQADPEALEAATRWYRESLALDPCPETRARLIEIYRQTGRSAELVHELRAALLRCESEDSLPLRLDLARTLTELGDLASASAVLQPAFEEHPDHPEVATLLEQLLIEQGKPEVLREHLLHRIEHTADPQGRRELACRAAALELDNLGQPAAAADLLRELADAERDGELEQLYGRALELAGPAQELETWLLRREGHLEGEQRLETLMRVASLQEQSGRNEEALGTLRRAERLDLLGQRERVRQSILALLRRHGNPELQLELLARLIEAEEDPSVRASFRRERARIWCEQLNQPDAALADLEAAQSEGPLDVNELRLLTSLHRQLPPSERQVSALATLAAASPDPEEVRRVVWELARLRADGPEPVRDPEQAMPLLRQLIESHPEDPAAFEKLTALLLERGRRRDLVELLSTRLAQPELERGARVDLAMRLARLQGELSEFSEAAATLREARAHGAESPALVELLHAQLEAAEDLDARIALCEEQTRTTSGPARERWLRRWLAALSSAGDSAEAQLDLLERLLSSHPDDAELMELRLPFLRRLGRVGTLAEALARLLECPEAISEGRRRLHVQELLRLYEGPLADPEAALALVERELPRDPSLRIRGIHLAERVGDPAREATLLRPLVLDAPPESPPPPDWVRRLALALAASEAEAEAEPLLWRALEANPRDREVLASLERLSKDHQDLSAQLTLLEGSFPVLEASERLRVAREAFTLAERQSRPDLSLRWLRRWQALAPLPEAERERWLELERREGDLAGTLHALETIRRDTTDRDRKGRLWAEQARIHAERGELELARRGYEEALTASPCSEVAWLEAYERVLATLSHPERRLELLRELAHHPELPARQRTQYLETRIALLSAQPELRSHAAAELQALIDAEPEAERTLQAKRMQRLLVLYADLERTGAWCELAARLLPWVSGAERDELERQLARVLTRSLDAREQAITRWEGILAAHPEDREALTALAELLHVPGREATRAEILERLAAAGAEGRDDGLLEAARLRWESLRDAHSALEDLEAALEIDPHRRAVHELRTEVCGHLGRPDEELESLRVLLSDGPGPAEFAPRWLRLGRLLLERREPTEGVLDAVETALRIAGDNREIRREARSLIESIGAWPRALELLHEELEAAAPEDQAPLLRAIARIEWDELGRAEPVCTTLEKLAEIETPGAEDRQRWGDALAALGRWQDAVRQHRLALKALGELAPARAWLELAHCTLERLDEPGQAREACSRALERDSELCEAVRLRAELNARLGDTRGELADRVRLAELLRDGAEAAESLSRAGELARDELGDDVQAWLLFRAALKKDPAQVPALLGAGRIALERGEWSEAERMFGLACSLLRETEETGPLAEVARLAAQAAAMRDRFAEAFRYLELALEQDPGHAGALDAMAELSLKLGAHERARTCLTRRLALSDLTPEQRAQRLELLSWACELDGELGEAAEALEQVVEIQPGSEEARIRCLDLLERIGEPQRASALIEGWLERVPPAQRAALGLRAARLEAAGGDRTAACRRLEALLAATPDFADGWLELTRLTVETAGPGVALEVTSRGLAALAGTPRRAPLLWVEARCLAELGRTAEATRRACETLEADLYHVEAARLLAENLGRVGDFPRAVAQLERTLEVAHPSAAVEAELWEALGRAYSGPLEDMTRARSCYQRALECNPLHTRAREALADVTAFDPAAHAESLRQHRDLLEAYPARAGSWRSLGRIGSHREQHEVTQSCDVVLATLGEPPLSITEGARGAPLVSTAASANPLVCGATELLRTLEESGTFPGLGSPTLGPLPHAVVQSIEALVGVGWQLDDDTLAALWSRPFEEGDGRPGALPRRARRRVRRALEGLEVEALGELRPEVWREEVLALAAAIALREGRISLRELLLHLLAAWPATSHLDLRSGGSLAAALQLCPPARGVMLRIADAVISAIGLG
ncbi:MAG: tetratricopeptide repeat protein [Myxococcota bacterium]